MRMDKQKNKRKQSKKVWSTPRVIVHGTVEKVTKGCDKEYGHTDGYTFIGEDIWCVPTGS